MYVTLQYIKYYIYIYLNLLIMYANIHNVLNIELKQTTGCI